MNPKRTVSRERGAALALMAGFMLVLLGVAALAVDMAMGFASRAEAQRIADSAALAGASAYLEMPADQAEDTIRARAYQYALMHTVRGDGVDSSEVTIEVLPDEYKVRVWVNRQALGTWFARLFGIESIDVGAMAAAEAVQANVVRCLKPFAIPDVWADADDDTNSNRIWDNGEQWEWGSDPGDYYERLDWDDYESTTATGYGSLWRDATRDQGRQIMLKPQNPQNEFVLEPGLFFPFRLPQDEDMGECDGNGQGGGGGGGGGGKGGGNDAGGDVYRNNICECNDSEMVVGDSVQVEPGDMVGPTFQGISELLSEDPDAYWDPVSNSVENTVAGSNWMASPRVVKVALMDIQSLDGSGMQYIHVNNFGLFFLEEMNNPQDDVTGRFIQFAAGSGEDPEEESGSLVLYLRLVE